MSIVPSVTNLMATYFEPLLGATLPICAAIFVVVPLFVHSSIRWCPKHSPSAFSVRGTMLSMGKHEKRSNKKFTDWLKKQESVIRTFRKILSFQSATLVMLMIFLQRLPGLLSAYRMKSKQLSLLLNPAVTWLLFHLLSNTLIQHWLNSSHVPDIVVECLEDNAE